MHFLLVGPGALGCLLSAVVIRGMGAHDRLTILDYNGDRARHLNKDGIVYTLGSQQERMAVQVVTNPREVAHVDVVLLCVKSYDVPAGLELCQPLLAKDTLLLFLQNGISHLQTQEQLGETTAAFGTTTEGATLLGPGQVLHAGSGVTYVGFLTPAEKQATRLLQNTQAVLTAGGLTVHRTDNILARLWAKLFVNVGINALTAILNCPNGDLLTRPGIDQRMQAAIDEAVVLARQKEIPIIDDPYQTARIVCTRTAKNVSSMLQDVRKKKRTEIAAINGAVVALARSAGINTPENDRLCQQIKQLEAAYV